MRNLLVGSSSPRIAKTIQSVIAGAAARDGGLWRHRVGANRDRTWLRNWITNSEEVDLFANMPAFGDTLTAEEMTALVDYLAARK